MRLSSTEVLSAQGNVAISQLYSWKKVAVLHDDSTFAREAAQAFIDEFTSTAAGAPGGSVLNADNTEFSLTVRDAPFACRLRSRGPVCSVFAWLCAHAYCC